MTYLGKHGPHSKWDQVGSKKSKKKTSEKIDRDEAELQHEVDELLEEYVLTKQLSHWHVADTNKMSLLRKSVKGLPDCINPAPLDNCPFAVIMLMELKTKSDLQGDQKDKAEFLNYQVVRTKSQAHDNILNFISFREHVNKLLKKFPWKQPYKGIDYGKTN